MFDDTKTMLHDARSSAEFSIVLGKFTFLDPRQQDAILLKALEQANCPARAMTVRNQKFAETILGQTQSAKYTFAFVVTLFPAKSRYRFPKITPNKLLAFYRLVQNSERVILLSDHPRKSWSGFVQNLFAFGLKCRFPRKINVMPAGTAAVKLLRHLKLREVPIDSAANASCWAFERILKQNLDGVALQFGHVNRALDAQKPSLALKASLAELERHARKLERKPINIAIRRLCLTPDRTTPDRIKKALSNGEGSSRILRHLRLIGADIPEQRRFTCPSHAECPAGAPLTRAFIKFLETGESDNPGYGAWLRAKLSPDDSPLTRVEWLLVLLLNLPIKNAETLSAPWADPDWRKRLQKIIPGAGIGFPGADQLSQELTIHGQVTSQTGLAQNLRMSHAAFAKAGVPVRLADQNGDNLASINAPVHNPLVLRRNIALHHLNADRIPQEIFAHNRFQDSYQIGFLLWELDRLPQAHALALDMLDEIWVPSIYLKNLYENATSKDVIYMRKALPLLSPMPVPKPASRMRFVMAYDSHSSTVRKNPIAAVHAFQAAFSGYHDVELIIKTTPVPADHWGDPEGQLQQLADAAQRDDRIKLITQFWPFRKLIGLIESADCLVSPHRAEGFGYIPAYAMRLGRPVIATDYSGTRDFCTDQTAFPVDYTKCTVPDGHAIYPTPDAQWAEIDLDHLAETMLRVYDFQETALKRAKRGQSLIKSEYCLEKQADRYLVHLKKRGLIDDSQAEVTPGLDAMFTKCS